MLSYFSELCANKIIRDAMLLMKGSVAVAISVRMRSYSIALWLGLHRTDHKWLWTDNSAWGYTKWASREPSPGVRAHFPVFFNPQMALQMCTIFRHYELKYCYVFIHRRHVIFRSMQIKKNNPHLDTVRVV